MKIPDIVGGSKQLLERVPRDALIVAMFVLASSASFGLGFLAGKGAGEGSGISLENLPLSAAALPAAEAATKAPALPAGGQVVASKNGTKYYLPTCGGASRINQSNKVWFASAAEAEAHGYAPAANCPGL